MQFDAFEFRIKNCLSVKCNKKISFKTTTETFILKYIEIPRITQRNAKKILKEF